MPLVCCSILVVKQFPHQEKFTRYMYFACTEQIVKYKATYKFTDTTMLPDIF